MIKCPKCGTATADIKYTGPVLFVTGTATVDASGVVATVGPAKAELTIAVGREFDSDHIKLICPNPKCAYTDLVRNFSIVRQCMISGKEADTEFQTSFGTTYWIASAYIDEARRIFSAENATPLETLEESMFYV